MPKDNHCKSCGKFTNLNIVYQSDKLNNSIHCKPCFDKIVLETKKAQNGKLNDFMKLIDNDKVKEININIKY